MNTEVNKVLSVVERGGIILYPTDTIWGLGCDATNSEAIARIYDLKKRNDTKSLIILLAEPKDIFRYVADPPLDIMGIVRAFEEPTTVIYDRAVDLPDNLVHADGSIAIRVTKDPFCKMLIKRMKKPLVSTSANISGQPSPRSFSDINTAIKESVDYCADYRRDEEMNGRPSRILKINAEGHITILRD